MIKQCLSILIGVFLAVSASAQCNYTVELGNAQNACSGTNVTLTAAVSGASGSVSYAWTGPTGATLANNSASLPLNLITSAQAGSYTCSVTVSGCANPVSDVVVINVTNAFTVNINSGTPIVACSGTTVNLNATTSAAGTYNYSWTGPNGFTSAIEDPSITNSTANNSGTYTITATNGGCSATGSVLLSMSTAFTINAGTDIVACSGNAINLYSTPSTTGTFNYSWTGPNGFTSSAEDPTVANPTANSSGTYTITATNGGCSATDNVVLSITNLYTVNAGTDFFACAGSSANFNASVNSTGLFNYSWTGPNGFTSNVEDPIIASTSANTSGNYTLTVTSGGCTISDVVNVTFISLNVLNPDAYFPGTNNYLDPPTIYNNLVTYTICNSNSVSSISLENIIPSTNNNATIYYLQWGNSPPAIFNNVTTQPISIGNNPFTISATYNGCQVSTNYNIYVGSSPYVGVAVGNSTSLCPGQGVVANINPINAQGQQNSPGTTYDLYFSNNPNSLVQTFIDLTSTTGANQYFFNQTSCGPGTSNNCYPNQPNVYYAYVVATNACESSCAIAPVITINEKPDANFTVSQEFICPNTTITLTNTGTNGSTISGNPGSGYTCNNTTKIKYLITPNTGFNVVSGNLGGTSGNFNSWTGTNSVVLNFTTAGTYNIVQYAQSNNCGLDSIVKTVCVINPPVCSFSLSTNTGCSTLSATSTNATITPTCSGVSIPMAYSWNITNPINGTSTISNSNYVNPNFTFTNNSTVPLNFTVQLTSTPLNPATNLPLSDCATICTQVVVVNPKPTMTSTNVATICSGTTLNIPLTANIPSTFTWIATSNASINGESLTLQNTNVINNNLTNLTSTSQQLVYTVTPTSSLGCVGNPQTVTINLNSVTAGVIGSNQSICSGGNPAPFTFNTPASGTNLEYQWLSSASPTGPFTSIGTGISYDPPANFTVTTYFQVVTTSTLNGVQCSATSNIVSVTVNPYPVANAGSDFTISCSQNINGQTIGITPVSGISYSWSPAIGLSGGNISNPIATPSATTIYTLSATNPTTGCTSTDQVAVTVNTVVPIANAGVDFTKTCIQNPNGLSIGTSTTLGNTYLWSPSLGLSSTTTSNPIANPAITTTYQVTVTNTASGCVAIDNVLVTVNIANPIADAGADFTKTCNQNPNGLQLGNTTVSGVTYAWSPSLGLSNSLISNPTANPISTTTYTLLATNTFSGCTAIDQVTVTVNTAVPIANAGINFTKTCTQNPNGLSIGTTSTLGYSYLWSPSLGLSSATISNPLANPTITTTYQVTVTNTASGCVASDDVLVTVNIANPIADAGTDFAKTCNQNPNGFQVGNTPVSGVTYAWSPTIGLSNSFIANPIANPASTTIYSLTATNTSSGCITTDQVIVTVDLSFPSANAGTDFTKTCTQYAQGGIIGVVPVAGVTYSWTPTTGLNNPIIANPIANPSITTTYTLTATNNTSGCVASDQVTVTVVNGLPVANAGIDVLITCISNPTGAAIGMAPVSGITYSWFPTSGLSNPNISNPFAAPNATTTYTLTATNTTTGCVITDEIIVSVDNVIPSAQAGQDFTITCVNNSTGLVIGMNALAGINYNWLPNLALSAPNSSNPTANPAVTTTYTLTATNPVNGCIGSDQILITVNTTPPTINAGPDVTINCVLNQLGASIGMVSSGSTNYTWIPNSGLSSSVASTTTALPIITTSYTLTGTNPTNGCVASDAVLVTVNNTAPISNAGNDFTKTCITNPLGATIGSASVQGLSYSWLPTTGLNFSNIANPIANPTTTTTYSLTTTNISSGCAATDQVTVTVNTNVPAVNAGSDFTINCLQNISGQAIGMAQITGVTYTWTPVVGLNDPNVSNPTASPITTTNYTLTATNTADGCSTSDNILVTVNTAAPVAVAGTDFTKTCVQNTNGLPIGMAAVSGISYSWAPATGLSSTSISNPVANPINSQTYVLTATNALNGCAATDEIAVIIDLEIPSANAGADFTKTCAENVSGLGIGMSAVAGVSYAWTPTVNLSSGTISNPIANPTATTTYTLTATDISSGCTISDVVIVTVNAVLPNINAGIDQVICEGTSISLNATGGNSYSWSNGYANGQPFFPSATGNYTVEGTNSATGCTNSDQVLVTVNPIPTVLNPADLIICNAGTTSPILFSGAVAGTIFSWTNNNTATNLAASGIGNITAFAGTNTTNSPISSVVTVVPAYTNAGGTCTGTSQDVLITINPTPTIDAISNQVKCVGETFNPIAFNSAFGVTGTTYTWTNTNAAIGLGTSGNGNIPAFTATNTTNAAISGTVTVTPIYTNAGVTCNGTTQSFTITVNPIPTVLNPADLVICNTGTTSPIIFSGAVAGTIFSWTNNNTSTNLAASGIGNIAAFAGTNTTNSPISSVVTVVPAYTNAGGTCTGTSQDVLITVNPTPTIDAISNQVKCVGETFNPIAFNSAFGVTGTTYTWTNTNAAIGLGTSGNGNIPAFTATNTTNAAISGTVTVTPIYTNAGVTCNGTTQSFTITVNPIPTVLNPADLVICNIGTTSPIIFSGAVAGTIFSWTNNNTATNLAASGIGNIAAFAGTNTTNSPISSVVTVTPAYTNAGGTCTGASQDVLITVNPTPTLQDPVDQLVCNGSPTTAINFSGTGTLYNWTNSLSLIGLAANGSGNIGAFTALNNSNNNLIAQITVIPEFTNANVTCFGNNQVFTITVNPSPAVQFSIPNQTICSQGNTNSVTLSSLTTGATISWVVNSIPASIGGLTLTNGSNTIPSFILSNSSAIPVEVQFYASASTPGVVTCPGSGALYSITVNPTPIINDPSNQVVCNGLPSQGINFTGSGTSYSWVNNLSSIGLAVNGTGSILPFNSINNSSSFVTATITATPLYLNNSISCAGTSENFTLTVNPTPIINPNVDVTFCNGTLTNSIPFTGNGSLYTWSNSNTLIGLNSSGIGNIPAFTATNGGTNTILSTLTVVPTYINDGVSCIGASDIFDITINPTPSVVDPPNQVICNSSSTTNVNFTGSASSYNWTNTMSSIGLTNIGGGNIPSFTASNSTNNPIVSNVTVTPIFTSNTVSCEGLTEIFTITVNPTPIVNDPADQTICNGASSSQVIISGTGTSYTWNNNTTIIGLASIGSNTIPVFTGQNLGATTVSGIVLITPSFTGDGVTCAGQIQQVTFSIHPTPSVIEPQDFIVCNGAATAPVNFTGTGTSYSWINNTPSIGLAGNGNGNCSSFMAINNLTTPVIATIIVTPNFTGGAVSCSGIAQTFTITVNPTPLVNDLPNQFICNGFSTNPIFFTGTGTSYTWQNSLNTIEINASGTGDIASFTAINTSSLQVNSVVTVTPQFTFNSLTCAGPTQTIDLNINPTPAVTQPSNIVLCNGAPSGAITFGGTGTSYTWTNTNSSIGIGTSGTGNIPSFNGINTGILPVSATISVTPVFTSGGTICNGETKIFTIVINPTPSLTDPSDITVCNGSSTTPVILSGTGTSYSWTNSLSTIGLSGTGTGDIPSFTGINLSTSPVIASITITPQYSNANLTCSGTIQVFTITVNPAPVVTFSIPNQTICSALESNSILISSATLGASITWSASAVPSTISGLTTTSGGNTIPQFTLTNSGTLPASVTIIASAITGGALSCPGAGSTYTITVNPTPTVTDPQNQVICNGTSTASVAFSGTGTSYTWANNQTSIGLAAAGTSTIPPFTAVNNTNAAVISTVTVTPHYTNNAVTCPGPTQNFTFTVNYTPTINLISDITNCANAPTQTLVPTGTGTSYNWVNSNPSIGLISSGIGNVPAFTTINTSSTPISSTVTYTPIYTNSGVSCQGLVENYLITVNPKPTVTVPISQTVCNTASTQAVNFTGTGTSYTWTNSVPSIGLSAAGTGNIIPFNGNNTTSTPVIASLSVTPQFTGGAITCPGDPEIFSITINPTPTVIAPANQAVCNGASSAQINFTGTGISYSWVNNNPTIGLSASGTGAINPFTAINTGSVPVTATITVTPMYTGNAVNCTGPSQSFTITINPTPAVVQPVNQVLCNNTASAAVVFSGNGTSYSWTNTTPSIGIPISGTGNITSFTSVNTTNSPIVATLTIVPNFIGGSASCLGVSQSFLFTINPTPVVNAVSNQFLCNGSSTTAINFTGTGTGYAWTNSATSIGLVANGTGNIGAFTATNTSAALLTGSILITPQYTHAGLTCNGLSQTITISVSPTPNVVDPADVVVCNGTQSPNISFTGNGTSYSWTNNNPSIGLPVSGNGNIASFLDNNPGTTPIVATLTVLPDYTIGGITCPGPTQTFTLTVNPTPTVSPLSNQTICNSSSTQAISFVGTGTSYAWTNSLSSIGIGGNGTGTIPAFTGINTSSVPTTGNFSVTPQYLNAGLTCSGLQQTFSITINPTPVVNDPPDLVVCNGTVIPITPFTGSGTYYSWTNSIPSIGLGAGANGSIPAFTAQNNSNGLQQVAQLGVTAYFNQGGALCAGNTQNFTFTVNPTTTLTNPINQVICNTTQTAAVNFVGTGTSYSWLNSNTLIGLAANGIGNIPAFTANNTTAVQDQATVVITPIYSSLDGLSCPGTPQDFTYSINPSPIALPVANFAVCNGSTINVPLSSNILSNFNWYADPNTAVAGDVNFPQPSLIVSNTLTNTSTAMQFITYHILPTSSPEGCLGLEATFVVQVIPDVEMTSIATTEICSGAFVNVALTANIPASFVWLASDNPNVTGENTLSQTGTSISDFLINNTTQNQLVVYSIIPTSLAAGCIGEAQTIAVLVRPPLALLSEDTISICSDNIVNLTFQANASASFNWFANDNQLVQGESTSVQNSSTILDDLVNATNAIQQIDYTVVATSIINGCSSPIFNVMVFVNPLPVGNIPSVEICTGGTTSIPISASIPSLFSWAATSNPVVLGETIQVQNNATIVNTLIHNAVAAQVVNYTVTPVSTAFGCAGNPFTIPVTVHPLPIVSFNTSGSVTCNLIPVTFNNTSQGILDYAWSFGDNATSLDFAPTHTYPLLGPYTVTLVGTNPITGCSNTFVQNVSLSESPEVDFIVSADEGCVVLDVTFADMVNDPNTTLLWNFGDGETSFQPNIVDHQYTDPGCYDVSLTVTNAAGCFITETQTEMVCVYAIPDALFTVSQDSMPTSEPVFELTNLSTNAYTYLWDFGNFTTSTATNPIQTYNATASEYVITLHAYNQFGCYDSMMLTVSVTEDLLYYVPNTFTPNGDGTNDIFLPVLTAGFDPTSYTLLIFNRWGEVLFESHDPAVGWDGQYKPMLRVGNAELKLNPCNYEDIMQDGTYTWKIQFTGLQNESAYEFVGHVNLLK